MPFESVYRVSIRTSCPGEEAIDSLNQSLGMELPTGYREYATLLGLGTMCTYLVVAMPDEIRAPKKCRELFALIGEYELDLDLGNAAGLDSNEFEKAIIFAYASAAAPIWFATPSRGPRLFEHVDGDTFEIEGGFFGLAQRCAVDQQHEFSFFEPNNGRRRMRQLYVRTGLGRDGFVEALARRWGRESIRCSRNSDEEDYPHYFVPAIEGHIELHLDRRYNRQLPGDSFFARTSYDIDSEADFSAFVEPLLLPGGGPHEFVGKPIWLP